MSVNKLLLRTTLFIISFLLFILILNTKGKQVEIFETKVYQKITGKSPQHFVKDANGIPYVVYEGSVGKQYNPVTVAEHALNLAQRKDTSGTRNFFNCICWLANNNVTLNDSAIIFLDYYDWPQFKMTAPWRSAMNQGRAMQAFLLAYEKTGDSSYLRLARKSMNTLFIEVKDGGVTYKDKLGYWYEEYADDSVPQSRVLNGMIVVLQGLSEYYKETKDTAALFLFNEGVKSVMNNLHLYNDKGHSNYDILGKRANPWYHRFHIELLDFLYSETHVSVFNEYKQKWIKYKEPTYILALFQKPTKVGVFTTVSTFIVILALVFGIGFILLKFKWLK
jgi:heparosan-N-sulfate-glucuronate 5-epimerase